MSEVENLEQLRAKIRSMIGEDISFKSMDTPEIREALAKVVGTYLDDLSKPFDHQVKCSIDPESQTLRMSFRMPPGFYTPEKVEELRAAGVVLEEVPGE